ncbi:hypothetical protein F4814DRAFT_441605 [Daldinia grandis]|nr:hypothetical protein F4814DRAFT_441605 [Daldinia grandis]
MKHRVSYRSLPQMISLISEIVLVSITMLLMCLAYLESSRKALWEVGGQSSWNSRSHQHILSESNLAISVLATVTCMARLILAYFNTTDAYSCLFDALNDIMLSGFWIYSVAAQLSNDFTHPDHLIATPWRLEESCGTLNSIIVGDCLLARTCFLLSVLSL